MASEIIFVRHGESVANLALDREGSGGERPAGHCSTWPLTQAGKEQARIAGRWLREQFGAFDQHVVSPYMRARQTALLLAPAATWQVEYRLREREWGALEYVTIAERHRIRDAAGEGMAGAAHSFYWRAPQGEALVDVHSRVGQVLAQLDALSGRVLVVAHGAVMWMVRMHYEGLTIADYYRLATDPAQAIGNCQVIGYRREPAQMQIASPADGETETFWQPLTPAPVRGSRLLVL